MLSNYYDTRQKSDGLWSIVGSLDGSNWYYLYENDLSFTSQAEARTWLLAEGYTHREIGNRMEKVIGSFWIVRDTALHDLVTSDKSFSTRSEALEVADELNRDFPYETYAVVEAVSSADATAKYQQRWLS